MSCRPSIVTDIRTTLIQQGAVDQDMNILDQDLFNQVVSNIVPAETETNESTASTTLQDALKSLLNGRLKDQVIFTDNIEATYRTFDNYNEIYESLSLANELGVNDLFVIEYFKSNKLKVAANKIKTPEQLYEQIAKDIESEFSSDKFLVTPLTREKQLKEYEKAKARDIENTGVVSQQTQMMEDENYWERTVEEVNRQREETLEEWRNYITKENPAYSQNPALQYLFWKAITKEYNVNKTTYKSQPPVLNRRVLADLYQKFMDKEVLPTTASFKSAYDNMLVEYHKENSEIIQVKGKNNLIGEWITIKGKRSDPDNFQDNVKRLRSLAYSSWCVKTSMAESYLSMGDFHIYIEKDDKVTDDFLASGRDISEAGIKNVKVGIGTSGTGEVEVQGQTNDGVIPLDYYAQIVEFIDTKKAKGAIQDYQLTQAEEKLKEAGRRIEKIKRIRTLANSIKKVPFKSTEQYLQQSGSKFYKNSQGKFVVQELIVFEDENYEFPNVVELGRIQLLPSNFTKLTINEMSDSDIEEEFISMRPAVDYPLPNTYFPDVEVVESFIDVKARSPRNYGSRQSRDISREIASDSLNQKEKLSVVYQHLDGYEDFYDISTGDIQMYNSLSSSDSWQYKSTIETIRIKTSYIKNSIFSPMGKDYWNFFGGYSDWDKANPEKENPTVVESIEHDINRINAALESLNKTLDQQIKAPRWFKEELLEVDKALKLIKKYEPRIDKYIVNVVEVNDAAKGTNYAITVKEVLVSDFNEGKRLLRESVSKFSRVAADMDTNPYSKLRIVKKTLKTKKPLISLVVANDIDEVGYAPKLEIVTGSIFTHIPDNVKHILGQTYEAASTGLGSNPVLWTSELAPSFRSGHIRRDVVNTATFNSPRIIPQGDIVDDAGGIINAKKSLDKIVSRSKRLTIADQQRISNLYDDILNTSDHHRLYYRLLEIAPEVINQNLKYKDVIDYITTNRANKLFKEVIDNSGPGSNTGLLVSKLFNQGIQAFYNKADGKVYVSTKLSPQEQAQVLLHEVIGHKGIEELLSDVEYREYKNILFGARDFLYQNAEALIARTGHKSLQDLADDYQFDLNTEKGQLGLIKELLARQAEVNPNLSWFERLVGRLQIFLAKVFGTNMSREGVIELLLLGRDKLNNPNLRLNEVLETNPVDAILVTSLNSKAQINTAYADSLETPSNVDVMESFIDELLITGEIESQPSGLFFTDGYTFETREELKSYLQNKPTANLVNHHFYPSLELKGRTPREVIDQIIDEYLKKNELTKEKDYYQAEGRLTANRVAKELNKYFKNSVVVAVEDKVKVQVPHQLYAAYEPKEPISTQNIDNPYADVYVVNNFPVLFGDANTLKAYDPTVAESILRIMQAKKNVGLVVKSNTPSTFWKTLEQLNLASNVDGTYYYVEGLVDQNTFDKAYAQLKQNPDNPIDVTGLEEFSAVVGEYRPMNDMDLMYCNV